MKYSKFAEFEPDLKLLVDKKETFTISKTNYTAKIKTSDFSTMYNEEGRENSSLLLLINKVRFHNQHRINESGVEGLDYFKLFDAPKKAVNCYKIDMTRAYWTAGMLKSIVTDEMEEMVSCAPYYDARGKRLYDKNLVDKKQKKARLVSLGSLATTKVVIEYEEGLKVLTTPKTQLTKNLYLGIHKDVDDIMKDISNRFQCFYYYFDCFFTNDLRVVKALEEYGFKCRVENARIKLDTVLENTYIHDLITGNRYNIREEHYKVIKK
jgi:hypothetical protein